MARPSKYETNVKPYFDQIRKWAGQGASERQMAEKLKIGYSTWIDYKHRYPEFSQLIKEMHRPELVEELRSALVRRALGFEYREKKEYTKVDPDTGQTVNYIEIMTRQALPDLTAIFGALNLYDETYVRDRANHELRRRDIELREAIAKANNFDLDIK